MANLRMYHPATGQSADTTDRKFKVWADRGWVLEGSEATPPERTEDEPGEDAAEKTAATGPRRAKK